MKQSKLESFFESLLNVVIGYGVALCSQLVIFPMFGVFIPFSANLIIGFWFTLISIVRSYTIRRWFNAGLHKFAAAIAMRIISRRQNSNTRG